MSSIVFRTAEGAPSSVVLMSQRIAIESAESLHVPCGPEDGEGDADHGHAAYGVYERGAQTITLDSKMGAEMMRETFLHESLHAMFALGRLDTVLDNEAHGIAEHLVATLAPILLDFIRSNPDAVEFLQEVQR